MSFLHQIPKAGVSVRERIRCLAYVSQTTDQGQYKTCSKSPREGTRHPQLIKQNVSSGDILLAFSQPNYLLNAFISLLHPAAKLPARFLARVGG